MRHASVRVGVHSPKGANFDSRFVSREGAKNAKERACDGFFVPSLEEISSATEFRSLRFLRVLRVRNAFAKRGECTRRIRRIFDRRLFSRPGCPPQKSRMSAASDSFIHSAALLFSTCAYSEVVVVLWIVWITHTPPHIYGFL